MSDIVERLRANAPPSGGCGLVFGDLVREAADEIERLREQIAALQASSGYEASIAQAEIERLRAQLVSDINAETEIDRLETEIERLTAEATDRTKKIDALRALSDARGAEIERLSERRDVRPVNGDSDAGAG